MFNFKNMFQDDRSTRTLKKLDLIEQRLQSNAAYIDKLESTLMDILDDNSVQNIQDWTGLSFERCVKIKEFHSEVRKNNKEKSVPLIFYSTPTS